MPLTDVVRLYYDLNVVKSCGDDTAVTPNNVTSHGLPLKYAIQHDYNLQKRIYGLRPDLHTVTDSVGHRYRVLLSPADMRPQHCDETGTAIEALSAALSIATLGAAWWVSAIVVAATTTAATVNKLELQNAIAKAQGVGKEILYGISVAADFPAPAPTQQDIGTLANNLAAWNRLIAQVKSVSALLNRSKDMPLPEAYLAKQYRRDFKTDLYKTYGVPGPPGWMGSAAATANASKQWSQTWSNRLADAAASAYVSDWSPYSFFYSDAVAQMLQNVQSAGVSAPNAPVTAPEAGIGIAALLLLLL